MTDSKDLLVTFVSNETYHLAVEKGFNHPTAVFFWDEKDQTNCLYQSSLQKWLREEHKIWVESLVSYLGDENWGYDLRSKNHGNIEMVVWGYKTYEEALEIALQKALKLIE